MENEFSQFAPELYDTISIYVMFLIKQFYRHIPSPGQLVGALEERFHLIESFQLGDISRVNSLRPNGEMHMGTCPLHLLRIIYYIVLGFNCELSRGLLDLGQHEENVGIIHDIPVVFWNLLYALPFVYPQMNILHVYVI